MMHALDVLINKNGLLSACVCVIALLFLFLLHKYLSKALTIKCVYYVMKSAVI